MSNSRWSFFFANALPHQMVDVILREVTLNQSWCQTETSHHHFNRGWVLFCSWWCLFRVMFQSNRVTDVQAKRKRMINFTMFLYSIISSSTKFICSINILALNTFACSFRLDKYWCLVFHAKNCFHQRKFGGTHQALAWLIVWQYFCFIYKLLFVCCYLFSLFFLFFWGGGAEAISM